MIRAQDLRIGNWIMVAGTGELHAVQVNIDNLRQLVTAPEYASGVYLSPEILEKCGFHSQGESVGSEWFYKLISISTNSHPRTVTYELNLFTVEKPNIFGINLEEQYFGHCNYVHQLQNIIFYLTGEELDINL